MANVCGNEEAIDAEISEKSQNLMKNLKIAARKDIKREDYMARRMNNLAQHNVLTNFGYEHRAISHLPAKGRKYISSSEAIGEIVLDPENKLSLLLKYEALGLDAKELRSDSIYSDCDPALKLVYLKMIPTFLNFIKPYNNLSIIASTKLFWDNLK